MFSLLSLQMFAVGAGVAVSVPLMLHMIQSSRTVKMPFSTIRFLKLAEKKSSRRIKMENILLLLLRTLLMFFISLAFGMPMVRTSSFGNIIGRTNRNIAIVIDTSYSMEYTMGKESIWSKAVDAAIAVVDGLNEGDQACVFLADGDVTPVVEQLNEDKEFVIGQIKALKCGFTSSVLAPAVMAANDALKADTRNREKEIHIITDNQALPWNSFGRGSAAATGEGDNKDKVAGKDAGADAKKEEEKKGKADASTAEQSDGEKAVTMTGWDPKQIDDKTAVFIDLLGVSSPENVAPAEVDISPKLIMSDMPSKITVSLTHCGSPRNTSVTMYLNGEELQKRSVIIGAEGAAQAVFTLPPLAAGSHTAVVELPEDNLMVDNKFYFLFKVKDFLPTLCVGTKNDTYFLAKAITVSTGEKSPISAKLIGPDQLASEKLSSYACIFLCDTIPMAGQEIVSLEQYVRAGGLLVIFPGDKGGAADYVPWSCMPAKPVVVKDLTINDRKQMLRWEKPRHPLLRGLDIGQGGAPVITIRRYLRFDKMEKDTEVIISAGADKPFLMDREFALGHVLLFNVSADRTWSNLPLSPYFLPFVHQVVQYGAGMGGFTPYVWAAKSIPLQDILPEATRETVILDPDGNNVSIRTAILENQTIMFAENISQSGMYTMNQPGSSESSMAFAVNVPRDESNLAPVDQGLLTDITGLYNLYISTNKDDMIKQINDHRMGKTLGETCLWIVLILSAVEFFYANMKTRTPSKLSDALGIEFSGEVTG